MSSISVLLALIAFSHNHIDAPLPHSEATDEIVGIYGNILYPQDREQIQQKKLESWLANPGAVFPLSEDDLQDVSLYILDRFCLGTLRHYFAEQVKELADLERAKQMTLLRAQSYKERAKEIPAWPGRAEILIEKMNQCPDQIEEILNQDINALKAKPESLAEIIGRTRIDLIEPPFTWDMRTDVFKQMVDKITSASPHSPYFLALQEVTPQALDDLKKALAERDLHWISFNNISGEETLAPRQEKLLGEAGGFTSTIALSPGFEVLKVQLGDLPTESGSVRKILGVRVRNSHTGEILNLFSTHTDHKIQNDIYARTAVKIYAFATQICQDDASSERRFILGGDLNVFEESGGREYVAKLRELFTGSRDFRETDYYAPAFIRDKSFIGRFDKTFLEKPSAFDQIIVGSGVELRAASREAGVYSDEGKLIDAHEEPEAYMSALMQQVTFSDHLFNIVRFH